ncbi:Hsp20/alpha crystallin family protein [Shewanella avicenniae]|uniref:Hsp20/alpha crystallin family protein n=1 Tax=Shewanella avicenniae TaxID=2814294 RepID=A0ABX7QL92_9GAMM|nr:Hsp20/alpha crystallin family protein [Shewanella avicenniae]QSX32223.1 Hsp20/alpha crystallin family protein [Shewanella avicenniae]
MKLRPWNPADEFDSLFNRFGSLMDWSSPIFSGQRSWLPATDISEDKDNYLLKVELPEISKDDITLNVDNGYLVLTGERKHEHTDDKQHLSERFYGTFVRRFALPDNVKEDAIDAKFDNGMLYLRLPKTAAIKDNRQKIEIH